MITIPKMGHIMGGLVLSNYAMVVSSTFRTARSTVKAKNGFGFEVNDASYMTLAPGAAVS